MEQKENGGVWGDFAGLGLTGLSITLVFAVCSVYNATCIPREFPAEVDCVCSAEHRE